MPVAPMGSRYPCADNQYRMIPVCQVHRGFLGRNKPPPAGLSDGEEEEGLARRGPQRSRFTGGQEGRGDSGAKRGFLS